MNLASTLLRIGWFNGNFESTLRQYHLDFVRGPTTIIPTTIKYYHYANEPGPHLIVASYNTSPIPTHVKSDKEFNLLLTITSENETLNKRILESFVAKTDIGELRESSLAMHKIVRSGMSYTFPVFKKLGKVAISYIASLDRPEQRQ